MKPILFSATMVQAILEGRKSMTRRVIRQKYDNANIEWFTNKYGTRLVYMQNDCLPEKMPNGTTRQKLRACEEIKWPYKPGDILWVRETWREQPVGEDDHIEIQYKADFTKEELGCYGRRGGHAPGKWKSSRFMPRSAARIFLKVKEVRVERLWEISEEDATTEGLYCGYQPTETSSRAVTAKQAFMWIWQRINGYERWLSNPWVWVIEFERCEVTQ